MKQKYYTVWKGRQTGIFDSWDACKKSVDGYVGAQYKSYPTKTLAELAFKQPNHPTLQQYAKIPTSNFQLPTTSPPILPSLCVDGAWNTVTGWCEYQGVMTDSPQTKVFTGGPYADGTNNIVEFLGLVHALRYCQENGLSLPIYTDSVTAIAWVRDKTIKTTQPRNTKNTELFMLLDDAILWLKTHEYNNPILKWQTQIWGEIPADFGRK